MEIYANARHMDKEKFNDPGIYGNVDYLDFKKAAKKFVMQNKHDTDDRWLEIGSDDGVHFYKKNADDAVNSPAHYTRGSAEAIDVIEEAIQDAPTPVLGMLQAQVLKYLLRLWLKDNPSQDAKKAQWYLTRLVDKLECEDC